ncbi:MAG: ribbon-helix-helix protein, CopG family [Candidatus Aenigmatarchaeota archaeon]
MAKRISTSIKIDPEILKQAKHYAIDEGITFSELVERALKNEIKK